MGFPDRIERTVEIAHPPAKVWAALTTAEGLGSWFGNAATIDLRPGGAAEMTWTSGDKASMRIERVEEPTVFGFTWGINGLPDDDPRRTYVEFTLSRPERHPVDRHRIRLRATAGGQPPQGLRGQHRGLGQRAGRAGRVPRCQRGLTSRPSPRRSSPPWPTRAGGRSWPHSRPAGRPRPRISPPACPSPARPSPNTWRCWREAGLVAAEPGERRRVRYRLHSAPMQVAQQFLAALARDWDRQLDALQDHLDAAVAAQPTRRNKGTKRS